LIAQGGRHVGVVGRKGASHELPAPVPAGFGRREQALGPVQLGQVAEGHGHVRVGGRQGTLARIKGALVQQRRLGVAPGLVVGPKIVQRVGHLDAGVAAHPHGCRTRGRAAPRLVKTALPQIDQAEIVQGGGDVGDDPVEAASRRDRAARKRRLGEIEIRVEDETEPASLRPKPVSRPLRARLAPRPPRQRPGQPSSEHRNPGKPPGQVGAEAAVLAGKAGAETRPSRLTASMPRAKRGFIVIGYPTNPADS
jgi:hypothetical protein